MRGKRKHEIAIGASKSKSRRRHVVTPAHDHAIEHGHTHDHAHDHAHGHAHDHDHAHAHAHAHAHGDADVHVHVHESGEDRVHELKNDLPRAAGAGKILFLDCFSGIAGDMLAAALLDLGVPIEPILSGISRLPFDGWLVSVPGALRHGIAAARFVVEVEGEQPARTYRDVREMFEGADWPGGARALALDALRRLGEAEAAVHRMPLDAVHFHEVGAVDSIVDLAAAALALDWLGARVVASPLPMGRGFTRAQHGTLPLPAPATLACLRDVPTYDAGIDFELVTPTGACIVAAAAREFSRWPRMRPERIGWGAGAKDLRDRPNALRVVLGAPDEDARAEDTHVVLEANVDDMTAELAGWVIERALLAGALDAWASPIVMKKGRPALTVSAIAARERAHDVAASLLAESTSIGLRQRGVSRIERPRRIVEVETRYGRIAVKIADGDGLPPNIAPEYDACRRLAESLGIPLKTIYAAALAAATPLAK